MNDVFVQVEQTLGPLWPVLLFLLLLLVAYVVARLVAGLVRRALHRTRLDDRLHDTLRPDKPGVSTSSIGASITFWVVFVLGIIVAFDVVNLQSVSGPLGAFVDTILGFVPNLIGAAILGVVAFAVAKVIEIVVTKALQTARVDERVAEAARDDDPPAEAEGSTDPSSTSLAETLGTAAFYFVILLFLPAILDALQLAGILTPVQGLVTEILAFLPNLLLAAIIVVVGAFVARILRKIVGNLAAAAGADRLSERVGLSQATGGTRLSSLLGLVVYILVLIPVLVAALQALAVEAVTAPASAMLGQFLEAIPRVFVAALIVVIAYVVGRLLASLVSNLLAGVGFDRLFEGLGFRTASAASADDPGAAAEAGTLDTSRPSGIVGVVVLVAVLLFAATEAAAALGLGAVAVLVTEFTVLAGQVLLGLLIFGVGLYLANLAYSTVRASGTRQSETLALAARISILVLAGAMALKQMGLADSIVNLAFGLVLGAIALAAAIAFGWGGREVAREQLEKLRDRASSGDAPGAAEAPGRRSDSPSETSS